MTPQMQREYQDNINVENGRDMLAKAFKLILDSEPVEKAV
jgi:hypothetical protein